MNTSDVISLLRATPAITDLVGTNIYNSRVPTVDPATGRYDTPFVWVQLSAIQQWDLNTPELGQPPLSKSFDVECVSNDAQEQETLTDAVYGLHGYRGALGTSHTEGILVSDQSDDYIIRNAPADVGVFVGSLLITAILGE